MSVTTSDDIRHTQRLLFESFRAPPDSSQNDRRSEVPTSDRRSFWDESVGRSPFVPAKPCEAFKKREYRRWCSDNGCYTENSRNNSGCSRCNSRCRCTSDDIRRLTQRLLFESFRAPPDSSQNDRRSEVPTSDRRSFWDESGGDVALPSPAKPCRKLSKSANIVAGAATAAATTENSRNFNSGCSRCNLPFVVCTS